MMEAWVNHLRAGVFDLNHVRFLLCCMVIGQKKFKDVSWMEIVNLNIYIYKDYIQIHIKTKIEWMDVQVSLRRNVTLILLSPPIHNQCVSLCVRVSFDFSQQYSLVCSVQVLISFVNISFWNVILNVFFKFLFFYFDFFWLSII